MLLTCRQECDPGRCIPIVFWVQGFAIFNDQIFFIKPGEDAAYYTKLPKLYKLKSGCIDKKVNFNDFSENMIEQIDINQVEKGIIPEQIISGHYYGMSEYMMI